MTAPTIDLTNIPEDARAIAEKVSAQMSSAMDFFRAPEASASPTVPPEPEAPATPPAEPAPVEPTLPPAADTPDEEDPDPTTSPVLDITSDELERLRALEAWARSLDTQTQVQFAGIARGEAVAIPTDEFARYRAWLATQQPSSAPTTGTPDLSDLDPEQAQYIQALQAQNAALAAERERLEQERRNLLVPDELAAQRQAEQLIADTAAEYARLNGFTEDQVGALLSAAVEANAFGMFAAAGRQLNPVTGQLLAEAPMDVVTRQALDFARIQRPDLLAGFNAQPTSPAPTPPAPTTPAADAPAPATTPADDPVARKKANAASLAAAPSAATAPPAIDPRALNPQDQRSLIADMIRQQTGAR